MGYRITISILDCLLCRSIKTHELKWSWKDTLGLHSLHTGAQNQINTLANCNHDEHDKIWNWIEQRLQIWRKIEFSPSPFRVTSQTAQPIQPSKAGSAGTVSLATLKGLGENSIFLQICNLYTIQFHILLCSSWLQFARVLIRFWELPREKF